MSTRSWPALTALLVLSAAGCGASSEATPSPTVAAGPTYYADVAGILTQSCTQCHLEGGIGPMALTSFDAVSPFAGLVADAVANHRMPPAQPGQGCIDYIGAPGLTDDEIQTIVDWAGTGAAEGDPADLPTTEPEPDPFPLSRIDRRLTMPVSYTPSESPDDYRCFLLDWPDTETVFAAGYGIEPGAPSMVHHVIAFLAGPEAVGIYEALDAEDPAPGYRCYGDPGGEGPVRATWLAAWSPGPLGEDYPEGTGLPIVPGSKIILQVHYAVDDPTLGIADQSSVVLRLEPTVTAPAQLTPIFDKAWPLQQTMVIPASTNGVTHTYKEAWPADALLHTIGMHMHTYGASGSVTVLHGDGRETCLIRLDEWDFHWQLSYRFAEPVFLNAGDEIKVECTFDNPTDTDLNWGDGTGDEMCIGIVYASAPY